MLLLDAFGDVDGWIVQPKDVLHPRRTCVYLTESTNGNYEKIMYLSPKKKVGT